MRKVELNTPTANTAKTVFESPTYKLDDKNIYEIGVKKVSNLFTEEKTYDSLISETSIVTLGAMVKDNMSDIKNMYTYWWLKQSKDDKDVTYGTDKIVFDKNITSKIDLTKQTYTATTTTDKWITITIKEGSVNKWTITLSKDANNKLTTTRK